MRSGRFRRKREGAAFSGKEGKMRNHKASAWFNANKRVISLVGGLAAVAILFTACFCGATTTEALTMGNSLNSGSVSAGASGKGAC